MGASIRLRVKEHAATPAAWSPSARLHDVISKPRRVMAQIARPRGARGVCGATAQQGVRCGQCDAALASTRGPAEGHGAVEVAAELLDTFVLAREASGV